MVKEFETQIATVQFDDDGILHLIYHSNTEDNLSIAKEIIATCQKASEKRSPMLVDIRLLKSITQEARAYYAGEESSEVLSAVANPTRYGVVRLLAEADGEVCACDLAPPLDVSQSAMSHALTHLHEAGLVHRRKQGRWRYYRTTPLAEELINVFDTQQWGDK